MVVLGAMIIDNKTWDHGSEYNGSGKSIIQATASSQSTDPASGGAQSAIASANCSVGIGFAI